MVTAAGRAAFERATRAPIAEIAGDLQRILGQKLAAIVAGIHDPKAVGRWARGEQMPHPETEQRRRLAFQVVELLRQVEAPAVIRAWFMGMNPDLDDRSPAIVITEDPALVLQAARSFVVSG